MNFFLSIKHKIWIAFMSLVLIYVLSGVITIYNVLKNENQIIQISSQLEPTIDMLEDMNFMVTRSRNIATRATYGKGSDHDREEIIRINQKEFPDHQKSLEKLISKWPNDKSLIEVNALMPSIQKVLNTQLEVVYLSAKGVSKDEISLRSVELLSLNSKILDKLQELEISDRNDKRNLETNFIESSNDLILMIIVISLIIAVIGVSLAFIMSNRIIKPINYISGIIGMLSKGLLPNIRMVAFEKEIAGIMQNLIYLKDGLKHTVDFANKIGSGNLNAEFNPLSDKDTMGYSLIQMRESLKDAANKDEERNITVGLIAEVSAILRNYHELEKMADVLLPFLCKRLYLAQGAFYITLPDDTHTIHLLSVFAYDRKKFLNKDFKLGEGMIGQAMFEKDLIHLTDLPDSYISIKSGILGDKKPNEVVFVPLISNSTVYGVIEFASITPMTESTLRQLRELSEIIGQTIFNNRVNEQTRKLLLDSQKMSIELQRRQDELHRNAIHMQDAQKQLETTNILLEEQIGEVKRSNKKIQVLLENTPGTITICDANGMIKYVSPSVINLLGYMPEEVVDTRETMRISEEFHAAYNDMLMTVINNPFYTKTIQYSTKKKNGQIIWIEATAKNMLKEGAIEGLVINSNDITQRKLAEKESRLRGQMQSLSENSPDLICRFSKDRRIYYINPVIEQLIGRKPEEFINQSIFETYLNEKVVAEWTEMIHQVIDHLTTVTKEIVFPTKDGEKIMSVNAIPEFNEENSLESILLVSSDVTERKRQELEINNKNVKISDSINYSRRIQKSILPDSSFLSSYLEESFILYKPKDVISGDFPWVAVEGDYIFVAAVDCTGHGVPGALISLVGYFLLNDIVRGQHIYDPQHILQKLDESVMHTLRQDVAGSENKDGMDMALIRVNLKTGEVIFAGAHRPLFWIADGELNELKGDKLPIGGGTHSEVLNKAFTQTHVNVKKGDVLLFGTDGYPDQFGGPLSRKFTPSRVRQLLLDTHTLSMDKMGKRFEQEIEDWRGTEKQTDDILMIGIRF